MDTLQGQHAVVTGGSRGIGAAIAEELARLGASVTLMGRDQARLDAQAERIGQAHGVSVAAVRCDVSSDALVREAFAIARETFGPAAILVNNAGVSDAARITELPREQWDRMLAVNLTGPFLCLQQVLPAMIEARRGRIVNIASMMALKGYSRVAAYSAAKAGLLGLTRAVAHEVVRHGITVNAICPGYTDTDMATQAARNLAASGMTLEEARAKIVHTLPRRDIIRPAEVAAFAGWLCTPAASAVTGQVIAVSAGEA
jgi:NAD(P)-dependent dehydrogenase (short-subunit alcohol dehydrogenase family)